MVAFDSVLAAVDFTPATEAVVRRALWLGRNGLARRVVLVHAIDSRLLDGIAQLGFAARSAFEASTREHAEQALDTLAARFAEAGLSEVAVDCRCGRPADELAAAIAEHAPGLVLAGGGNRGWRQVVLGSTARGLLRVVDRPLWLIRGDGLRAVERVLLASDLRPSAAHAARLAADLWPQAELELLHVCEYLPDLAAGLASNGGGTEKALRAELEQQAERRLHAFAAEAFGDRAVTARLEHGHPVGTVLRRVRETRTDLLALGRSGRRGVESAVLGSVAEALVEMVDCDLLLVPPPQE